ncbi:MAG TPA: helix-turn-helix transcriptional regulator [Polyangia bacterium]|nr:helix-turn-helix transcriptional regulator [Polyangia bacterium]
MAKAVARRIREARERAGLTQEALAQRVRVETTTLSRYERGVIGVSLEMLELLADALHVPLRSLLETGVAAPGLRRDEDEVLRAYRTLSASQKRIARWLVPRLRELK